MPIGVIIDACYCELVVVSIHDCGQRKDEDGIHSLPPVAMRLLVGSTSLAPRPFHRLLYALLAMYFLKMFREQTYDGRSDCQSQCTEDDDGKGKFLFHGWKHILMLLVDY
jgi:hypothetical protein